mmetsp:Transcript_19745/g.75700  ORF Transcript_19745/g.75700 Transcript_19745/m.75700 type:complete len:445 (+) Transcript_19745:39-1373(+)
MKRVREGGSQAPHKRSRVEEGDGYWQGLFGSGVRTALPVLPALESLLGGSSATAKAELADTTEEDASEARARFLDLVLPGMVLLVTVREMGKSEVVTGVQEVLCSSTAHCAGHRGTPLPKVPPHALAEALRRELDVCAHHGLLPCALVPLSVRSSRALSPHNLRIGTQVAVVVETTGRAVWASADEELIRGSPYEGALGLFERRVWISPRELLKRLEQQSAFHNPYSVELARQSFERDPCTTFIAAEESLGTVHIAALRKKQYRHWADQEVAAGVSKARQGQFREAMVHYDKALGVDGKHANAMVAKGAALANLDDLPAAAALLSMAARIDPDHPNAPTYLAAVEKKIRTIEEEKKAVEAALRAREERRQAREQGKMAGGTVGTMLSLLEDSSEGRKRKHKKHRSKRDRSRSRSRSRGRGRRRRASSSRSRDRGSRSKKRKGRR